MNKNNDKNSEEIEIKMNEHFFEIKCFVCPKCNEWISIYVNESGVPIEPEICPLCGNKYNYKDIHS